MKLQRPRLWLSIIISFAVFIQLQAHGAGMIPETSVVLLNEEDGETTINIHNSDDHPSLLYSAIHPIEGDQDELLVLSPPVARVEAGERQSVRILLRSDRPLTVQRLRRITFEGIKPRETGASSRIGMSIRQNLPIIINPKGLPKNPEPWIALQWTLKDRKLMVINPSAYVVRMAQQVDLLPSAFPVQLPKMYVLPGETMLVELPDNAPAATLAVRLYPATVYGYSAATYEATLTPGRR